MAEGAGVDDSCIYQRNIFRGLGEKVLTHVD